LTVALSTPNTTDGGMLFTIDGVASSVTSTSATNTLYWRAGTGEVRVLVFGNLASGPLLTLDVPDIGAVEQYSATVVEVTDRNNQIRANVSGYAITFSPLAETP
jgi:hypothetical protein